MCRRKDLVHAASLYAIDDGDVLSCGGILEFLFLVSFSHNGGTVNRYRVCNGRLASRPPIARTEQGNQERRRWSKTEYAIRALER